MRCQPGTKTIEYGRVDIHLHYCNHNGDNVTISIVNPKTKRPRTAKYKSGLLCQYRVKCGGNTVDVDDDIIRKYQ
jgi:hypothetical protein